MCKPTKKKLYTDYPFGKEPKLSNIRGVDALFPPLDRLTVKEEQEKVTLALSKSSVDFFKQHAKANKISYQKMIRTLLDEYVKNIQSIRS